MSSDNVMVLELAFLLKKSWLNKMQSVFKICMKRKRSVKTPEPFVVYRVELEAFLPFDLISLITNYLELRWHSVGFCPNAEKIINGIRSSTTPENFEKIRLEYPNYELHWGGIRRRTALEAAIEARNLRLIKWICSQTLKPRNWTYIGSLLDFPDPRDKYWGDSRFIPFVRQIESGGLYHLAQRAFCDNPDELQTCLSFVFQ